jgi:hypothetical protein
VSPDTTTATDSSGSTTRPTTFARFSPRVARAVLLVAATTLVAGVAITFSPLKSGFADVSRNRPGDVPLYRAEVDRIATGEPYYIAAATELVARGYPTRSVFNWRTPLPMLLIGRLPDPVFGKALLAGLAGLLILAGFVWVEREASTRQALAVALMLTGVLMLTIVGDLFVMPVLWSGVLIALSIAAFGLGRARLGIVAGIAALFFRELAALYCVVCWLLDASHRRWRLVAGWTLGMAAYAVFYAFHIAQVSSLIDATARAHDESWLQLGGAAFVISTAQMNAYLLVVPQWISAVCLVLAVLGLASWNTAAGQRIGWTMAGYMIVLALVGQPFNQYWGCLYAPLICFGLARAPAAVQDLLAASGWWHDARPSLAGHDSRAATS